MDKVRKLDQSGASDFERESYHQQETSINNNDIIDSKLHLRTNFTASPFRQDKSLLDKKTDDANNHKALKL